MEYQYYITAHVVFYMLSHYYQCIVQYHVQNFNKHEALALHFHPPLHMHLRDIISNDVFPQISQKEKTKQPGPVV